MIQTPSRPTQRIALVFKLKYPTANPFPEIHPDSSNKKTYISLKTTAMEDKNKPVLDALIRKGFPQLKELNYKFTEYSLNTEFSFKFDSLLHLVAFLNTKESVTESQISLLETALLDVNLQSDSYFFINFFAEESQDLS